MKVIVDAELNNIKVGKRTISFCVSRCANSLARSLKIDVNQIFHRIHSKVSLKMFTGIQFNVAAQQLQSSTI